MATWSRKRWRTVNEDHIFLAAAARIQSDARRLDEMLDGVKQVVARKAEDCHLAPNTTLRVIKTRPFPGAPAIRVAFTIDDESHATLRMIGLLPANTPDEELDDLDALLSDDEDPE